MWRPSSQRGGPHPAGGPDQPIMTGRPRSRPSNYPRESRCDSQKLRRGITLLTVACAIATARVLHREKNATLDERFNGRRSTL